MAAGINPRSFTGRKGWLMNDSELAKRIAEGYEIHLYIINSVAKVLLSSDVYREFVKTSNALVNNKDVRHKAFNLIQMSKSGFHRQA